MTDAHQTKSRTERSLLYCIIALCVSVELVLTLVDVGVLEISRLRQSVYEYAGFWPGLLSTWQPNYALQPYLMFVTYSFLHGGLMHLVVNMMTLWSIGRVAIERVGSWGFMRLYAGSILGGAIGYGLLADSVTPMVGASGALFGIIGGLLAWAYIDRFNSNENLWPIARAVLLLIGLNVVLWWAMDGHLAWQTHLGGFLAGWVLALLIDPRPID